MAGDMGGMGGLINPEDWSNLGFTNKTLVAETSVILSDPNTPHPLGKSLAKKFTKRSVNQSTRTAERMKNPRKITVQPPHPFQ